MLVACLWDARTAAHDFEYIEELVHGEEIEIIRSKQQRLGDYRKQWLVKIDNPQVLHKLMTNARLHGENLAANPDWIEEARQFAPKDLKGQFNQRSEYIGIFFQRGTKHFGKAIDIVVSTDQKMVYLNVWGT